MSNDLRLLEAYEVPLLIPKARDFFAEGLISGKLNEKVFIANVSGHIERGTGFVFVGGFPFRGAIGGMLFNDLATGELGCIEHFWFVGQEERGSLGLRLLSAFEKEAFARGALRVLMAHFTSERTAQFVSLYERRGYVMREQIFVKERP